MFFSSQHISLYSRRRRCYVSVAHSKTASRNDHVIGRIVRDVETAGNAAAMICDLKINLIRIFDKLIRLGR